VSERDYINVCPECKVHVVCDDLPSHPKLNLCVCYTCGHLILGGWSADGQSVRFAKVTRDYLYKHYGPDLAFIRELQEQVHREVLHQWG
jgi:hypothetical protein